MAVYSIRLDGDTRAMLRRIRSFSEIDKQGINAALAEGARESTLERFKQSKGPDGRRWKTSIRAAQEGGKWVTKKQVRITIPARPFLGLSEDDMQEMKATVEEFIQKED